MDDSKAGPSRSKKPRIASNNRFRKYLTEEELERMLYESDDELEDPSVLEFDALDKSDSSEAEEDSEDDSPPDRNESDKAENDEMIDWQVNPHFKVFNFTKVNEPLVPLPVNSPMDIFNLLLDESLYQLIVNETNRYAEELFLSKAEKEHSRISKWKNVTVDELKIFLGLFFHMGTIQLTRLQDYWKTDRLFNFSCFSSYMSRDRFLLILRCLHFAANPVQGQKNPSDRLFKIRSVINYFNNKMSEVYYPQRDLCIDESMVLWRGRLVFRQYIQNKRHKYGVKFYMLTEPCGLILKFSVYTGALDDFGGKGHASKVVLHLIQEKLKAGHALYMDNYYNSYNLSRQLLAENTYTTGTLRIDRQNAPPEVKLSKLKKGETIARYSNGVMIARWRDKRDVNYISTEFENNLVQYFDKRGNEKEKPLPIVNYNKCMGGIDRQDQLLAYYPCSRKTIRWYKKIGLHIIHLLFLNSFLLYKKYKAPRMRFYDFRLDIIRNLLPEHMYKKPENAVMYHFIRHCKMGPNKKTLRKKCKNCTEKGIRKDTIYECKNCNAGFCLEPCFEEFHMKLIK